MSNIPTYFILFIGLLVVLAGVYLSWHKKGNEAWATYLFGFLLVVIGGPLGNKLDSLKLSNDGVDLTFSALSENTVEVLEVEKKAVKSLLNIQTSINNNSTKTSVNYAEQSGSLQTSYLSYFNDLGYIPTQIVGSESFKPGTVIKFEDGSPVVLATQNEAFKNMIITSSKAVLPDFLKEKTWETEILKNKIKFKAKTSFKCQKAKVQTVSINALKNSINSTVINQFIGSSEIFVIYETIGCDDLRLDTKYLSAGDASVAMASNIDSELANRFSYSSDNPVILGYKLLTISSGNTE